MWGIISICLIFVSAYTANEAILIAAALFAVADTIWVCKKK